MTQAGLAHAPALAALHALAFPPEERWGTEVFAAQLSLPGVFAEIAGEQGFVLARVAADEAEILTLAVCPPARRKGVGGNLLRTAMARAAELGAVVLFLEVAEGNVAARALYDRWGFADVGRRRRYYPDGSDALVLRRELPPVGISPAAARAP